MKHVAVFILVCLLLAGTVSAVSMNPDSAGVSKANPGSAGVSKPIVTTSTTVQVQKIPSAVVPIPITPQGHGMIEVYSDPSGADVALAGPSSITGTTPAKFSVPPGTYTVTVSKAGYKNHVETFPLTTGAIKQVDAKLMRVISGVSPGTVMPACATGSSPGSSWSPGNISPGQVPVPSAGMVELHLDSVPSGASVSLPNGTVLGSTPLVRSILPGSYHLTFSYPGYDSQTIAFNLAEGSEPYYYTADLVPSTSLPVIAACPDAAWSCLTPAEAVQQFGASYTTHNQTPCGFTETNGQVCYNITYCAKYCVQANGADLAGSAGGNTEGAGSAGPGIAGGTGNAAPAGPLQPVFDFFNSIFGTKNPAEERLQRIGLNPQPEPPAQEPVVK